MTEWGPRSCEGLVRVPERFLAGLALRRAGASGEEHPGRARLRQGDPRYPGSNTNG